MSMVNHSSRRDLGPNFGLDFSAWCRRKLFAGGGVGVVGGAWRDCREMWYSAPGAGRSRGVFPGPVALRAPEVAS